MTKTQRIEEMEKQLALLKIELKEDIGPLFIPKKGDDYFYLRNNLDKGMQPETFSCSKGSGEVAQFRALSTCQAFAEAINIWLEWNMCEGVVGAKDSVAQFTAGNEVTPYGHVGKGFKLKCLSPCFDTKANLQASIDLIGKERIMKMRKGFHLMG